MTVTADLVWMRTDRSRGGGWTFAHAYFAWSGIREGRALCGYDPMPKAGEPDTFTRWWSTGPRCSRCEKKATA